MNEAIATCPHCSLDSCTWLGAYRCQLVQPKRPQIGRYQTPLEVWLDKIERAGSGVFWLVLPTLDPDDPLYSFTLSEIKDRGWERVDRYRFRRGDLILVILGSRDPERRVAGATVDGFLAYVPSPVVRELEIRRYHSTEDPMSRESKFKAAVRTVLATGEHPSGVHIRRALGILRYPTDGALGTDHTRWRDEVLTSLGWTKDRSNMRSRWTRPHPRKVSR